jgi:hypothetical protein
LPQIDELWLSISKVEAGRKISRADAKAQSKGEEEKRREEERQTK